MCFSVNFGKFEIKFLPIITVAWGPQSCCYGPEENVFFVFFLFSLKNNLSLVDKNNANLNYCSYEIPGSSQCSNSVIRSRSIAVR